jgi:proteasome accessory factor B
VSDQKTERLINLTMALLATTRYLSKSEIFQNVAGYSGSVETMERMFERDKENLREIGLRIDVAPLDLLFDDEVGYRIKSENYALALGELTPTERSYASLAATLWRNRILHDSGHSALLKLSALGGSGFGDDFGSGLITLENDTPHLDSLWNAIENRTLIHFSYANPEITERTFAPYGLSLWHGVWYVVGFDTNRQDIRVFRLSRITSSIEIEPKKNAYVIPDDFHIKDHLVMLQEPQRVDCLALIRVDRCHALRALGTVTSIDAEWDQVKFRYQEEKIHELLWFADDLILQSPESLRESLSSLIHLKIEFAARKSIDQSNIPRSGGDDE